MRRWRSVAGVCAFVFFSAVMLFVFRNPIISHSLSLFLRWKLPADYALSASFDNASISLSNITLHNFSLRSKKYPDLFAHIDRCELFFSSGNEKKHVRLHLEQPTLSLGVPARSGSTGNQTKALQALYVFADRVTASNGTLIVPEKRRLAFALDAEGTQRTLWVRDGASEVFTGILHREKKALFCSFTWGDVSLPTLHPFMSERWGTLRRGASSGAFDFRLNRKGEIDALSYSLSVRDAALDVHGVRIELATLSAEKSAGASPFDARVQLHNASVFHGDRALFSEIHGYSGSDGELMLTGSMRENGAFSPFLCKGSVTRATSECIRLTYDMHASRFTSSGSAALHQSMRSECRVEFSRLDVEPFLPFIPKQCLAYIHPALSDIALQEGVVSGSADIRFAGGALEAVEVEELSLRDFRCSEEIRGEELQCFFRYVGGSVPSWGVHLANLDMPQYNLHHLSGDFAVHEHYIIPSHFSGKIAETKLDMYLRGIYPNVKLQLEVGGVLSSLFDTYVPGHQLTVEELGNLRHLSCSSTLRFQKPVLSIDSKAILETAGGLEKLKARAQCSYASAASGVHCERVDFSSDSMTTAIANICLGLSGEEWRLEGRGAIKGTLDPKQLILELPWYRADFYSPALHVFTRQRQLGARFIYDRREGFWQGTTKIHTGKIYLPKCALHLSDACGDLRVKGKELYIDNVSARYEEEAQLSGRMVVAFQEKNEATIDLITSAIEGRARCFERLLHHFRDFEHFRVPVDGDIYQKKGQGLRLKAALTHSDETIDWNAELSLKNGVYAFTPETRLEQLSLDISWLGSTNALHVRDINGRIASEAFRRFDGLRVKRSELQLSDDVLRHCALFIDTPTHEFAAIVADVVQEENGYALALDTERSHICNALFGALDLAFVPGEGITRCRLDWEPSWPALQTAVMAADAIGALSLPEGLFSWSSRKGLALTPKVELSYDKKDEALYAKLTSDTVSIASVEYQNGAFELATKGQKITKAHCTLGDFACYGVGSFDARDIALSSVHFRRKRASVSLSDCVFNMQEKTLEAMLNKACVYLPDMREYSDSITETYWGYLQGSLTLTGRFSIDFSQGMGIPTVCGSLDLIAPKVGKGELQLLSQKPFRFSYTKELGLSLEDIDIKATAVNDEGIWADVTCAHLSYDVSQEAMACKGMRLLMPPEMCFYIARTQSVPYVATEGHKVIVSGVEIPWENQIDVGLDLSYSNGAFSCNGTVQEGYFWIGKTSCYVRRLGFGVDQNGAHCAALFDAYSIPLALTLDLRYQPHMALRCSIEDKRASDVQGSDAGGALTCVCARDAGQYLTLKSVEGDIFGLNVFFQGRPQKNREGLSALTGKIKCHAPLFATLFPDAVQKIVQNLGMGTGYELSGDVAIDWQDLHHSQFTGYIKGKNFELLDASIQTLMGSVTASNDTIRIEDFIVSDEAGRLTIKEIQCVRDAHKQWHLNIPHISLSDFRPSLLKKIGQVRSKIKPLVVRKLDFRDIHGALSDSNSFTGRGSMTFTNTFKQAYNLLDIPFELIARLGLDMKLLVPVKGSIDCEMHNGKIFLTALKDSCSEGKRSKFYLSKNAPSYISLDGELDISIKMKQYVILKVTEPFILSIQGGVSDPKYSLR